MSAKLRTAILIIILITPIVYIFSHIGYRADVDTDYWPSNQVDSNDYVWISEDQSFYLVNYEAISDLIGFYKGDAALVPVCYSYGRYNGNICINVDEFIDYMKTGAFKKESSSSALVEVLTDTALFSEDGFVIDIKDKSSDLYFSGPRKIVLNKYRKDDYSPSYFGFQIESWDDIWKSVHHYYYVEWNNNWGYFSFDDFNGVLSEKEVIFEELLNSGNEVDAMKLVDSFGDSGSLE